MPKLIAVTIGDINGIGINILLDLWIKKKFRHFILLSDIEYLKKYIGRKNLKIKLNQVNINKNINYNSKELNVYSYNSLSPEHNTYQSLKFAYKLCINHICIGIITLPLRKDLIIKNIDKKFIGQTEFFQKINKKNHSNMILYNSKIIVSPLTTHIEIKKLPNIIKDKKYLFKQIINLYYTLKIDFNIKNPRLMISGFNPHAGERGNLGKEEIDTIIPVIKQIKKKGISINGPMSADSMLIKNNLNNYDCFIFMYHDQALIPFKFISQFSGVNYTGNLNIIRTSPDHGTAYNLIESKKISNKSLVNCIKLVKRIYNNRNLNDKS